MKPDTLLIYSGGVDSTTMLYEYRDRIALALSFHYGSNHNDAELACARWHCARLGIRQVVIPLGFMAQHFRSALFEGADAVPGQKYDEQSMHSTVVPFRNGIMLSIAAGMAESEGLRQVMMANHSGDHSIYPDCRPAFVDAMGAAISAGTYDGVVLDAPYTRLTKADIVRRGTALGVDYGHTWSCYKGGEHACGVCGTCVERREAFAAAGQKDPAMEE
ncbi:MAG: queuosine biosynthesis protein QueC [bacterium P3]|nr:MAG: queuosine biosynthesis protein QueC [bacterium P3]KWW40036.1 MAG: queuosine biosynthesis protein QueC [bacterium F083]